MQALKMFNGGGGGSGGHSGGQGGGQQQFIGMAMGEASKLFGKLWDYLRFDRLMLTPCTDQQNSQGNATGSKESAVQSAAQMALKMYMKSQMGGGGSGAGGLMSMASKFM